VFVSKLTAPCQDIIHRSRHAVLIHTPNIAFVNCVLDVYHNRRFLETTKPRAQRVLSGRWTTCNANLAGSHHHKLGARKIFNVFREHGIELFELGLEFCSWKPKEHDASVG
jgi:hypothetical protein